MCRCASHHQPDPAARFEGVNSFPLRTTSYSLPYAAGRVTALRELSQNPILTATANPAAFIIFNAIWIEWLCLPCRLQILGLLPRIENAFNLRHESGDLRTNRASVSGSIGRYSVQMVRHAIAQAIEGRREVNDFQAASYTFEIPIRQFPV